MKYLEQEGLLFKEEASGQEFFSENSKAYDCIQHLGRHFFGTIRSRKAPPFMTLLALLSICTNAVFIVGFFIVYRKHYLDKPSHSIG